MSANTARHNAIALPANFWDRVEKQEGGCWIWQAGEPGSGYGQLTVGSDKGLRAHRLVYANLAEALIPGLVLHHICGVRRCVNPQHLVQLTRRSHILLEPQGASEANRRKTHCPNGHPYSGENVFSKPSDNGRRRCRTCTRESQRSYRSAKATS